MEPNLENKALRLILKGKVKETNLKNISLSIFLIGIIAFLANQYVYPIYHFNKVASTIIILVLLGISLTGGSIEANHILAKRNLKKQLTDKEIENLTQAYDKLKKRRTSLQNDINELQQKKDVLIDLIDDHPELKHDFEKITKDIHNKQVVLNKDESNWLTIRKINKYLNHEGKFELSIRF